METFFAIEPKTIMVVLLNFLLWVGIGFLLYKLIRRKKKQGDNSPELELDEGV